LRNVAAPRGNLERAAQAHVAAGNDRLPVRSAQIDVERAAGALRVLLYCQRPGRGFDYATGIRNRDADLPASLNRVPCGQGEAGSERLRDICTAAAVEPKPRKGGSRSGDRFDDGALGSSGSP